ncbi:1,2-phenylacetyl-CoA epoxidase subunit PaaC [Nesterenkonia alkaliphila]|uniref:Phenylacetate-CoA oxygenase subunit PaaC n=1 Tax=Nesterenkonia alkaliphila TaxID=1463631 RepID=A0A7K1UJS2_9MICC|nr:1,2-phenylacetyl-CoA epoxidase subunit PaaC [Nesterenkonia alkaliphila]MVT26733.1 phenylacetate-CoA oxygenase subunit PaaC [Nesterenkonia alkaliphila]GFZ77051.1 phenylacetic acid degradation protein [Nesterenkonia alkaliphila]
MSSFTTQDSATRISVGDAITPEDLSSSGAAADEKTARYALILGDDSLILAQRLGHWISRAPELEEDIALGNIALDLLGHARFFLTYAGTAWGKTEDDLAYFRDEEEFRSARLVEQENGDFAKTIARQLIFSFYSHELYSRLVDSADETLAAVAEKALKEVAYHQDHAAQWLLRLAGGTEESQRRMQAGLESVWAYVQELFYDAEPTAELAEAGIAVLPSSLRESVMERLTGIIEQAGLRVPEIKGAFGADRSGRFSEQRGFILAEMQVLARQHPGASW